MKTNFSCFNRAAGFYADVNAHCKIYHTCDEYGNKFTYHCPEETAFRQDALICDHAHLVHCEGHISSNAKECIEKNRTNNSCCSENIAAKSESLFQSFHVTQAVEGNNKMQHGFVFNPRGFLKNFNTTETAKIKVMNSFQPLNNINFTTSISVNNSINTRAQYMPTINNRQESGLKKNANFSIPSQSIYSKDKFNEKQKMDQEGYLNKNINNPLYNFLKLPPNTFSESIKNQENNIKNHQSTRSPNDFLRLSSANHRNYLETLKSIQKNTKIPVTMAANIVISTTELPVYALTLSLKPLIPGELEYDPYYPKISTSTESYYTPIHDTKEWPPIRDFTQTTWSSTHFQLPPVLPDLNSLEDIVDRRKLLYIPRNKFN
ncbi:hypothetical protein WH47_08599 [Habropoda laboriosa]|uniref:Chitin-binding type-2 domain-containing protein n=2 Tax=Habropoda laboriosa TaxID=597456 RepID=A0A0L7QNS0_9HYME|nr:hypothetical protein WH47_08599 [Habropoda laboriosa]